MIEVVNWSIRNRVKLNTDKCKELRISFTSDCDFPPVVIGEECIKLVKDAKLLGVTISGDLTWNAHITEVTKKAAKRLYFLVQLKRARVPQKDLCLFCITCVHSVIEYLPFARIRTRSEKSNANHMSWYRISASFSAYEFTNGCGASPQHLHAHV